MAHLTLHQAVGLADETQNPGDPFDRLVAENQDRVARLVYRLLGWRESLCGDVDDIVQDVFLAAFKNLKTFRDESTQWTWLAAIAINRCRSHRRRKLLEFRWLKNATNHRATESPSAIERDETSNCVRRAVAELPPQDREVIVLYYLEDWTVAQISKTCGASPAAIDVRLHRARQRLRKILGESPE
jgi:RNA polymerase sigma factor (sigma-70 family)